MAFQTPNTPAQAPVRTPSANRGQRANMEYEKALGFINIYLPTQGGQRRKLGSIPLNESKAVEKQVFDRLKEDPALVENLVKIMIVEFNEQIDEAAPENQIAF